MPTDPIVAVSRAIHRIVGYSSYAVSSHPVTSASSLSVDISDDSMSLSLSRSVFRFAAHGGSCVYDRFGEIYCRQQLAPTRRNSYTKLLVKLLQLGMPLLPIRRCNFLLNTHGIRYDCGANVTAGRYGCQVCGWSAVFMNLPGPCAARCERCTACQDRGCDQFILIGRAALPNPAASA